MKNPPAFPIPPEFCDDLSVEQQRGMTLRDYFAAKAMQSLIAVYQDDKNIVDEYAQRAYEIANAMLKAREA